MSKLIENKDRLTTLLEGDLAPGFKKVIGKQLARIEDGIANGLTYEQVFPNVSTVDREKLSAFIKENLTNILPDENEVATEAE